jgi:hypothetical protein
VSQLRALVRATRPAVTAWLQSSASQGAHPFQRADYVIGEEDLATLAQAVLGQRAPQSASYGWPLDFLSRSDKGPWVYAVPDAATARLADLPEASRQSAADYLLDVEEADLAPQARSGPATRPARVSWWRDEVLPWACSFAQEARSHDETLFLIVSA